MMRQTGVTFGLTSQLVSVVETLCGSEPSRSGMEGMELVMWRVYGSGFDRTVEISSFSPASELLWKFL